MYELKQARDIAIFENVQANRELRIEFFTARRDSDYYAPIEAKVRKGIALSPEEEIRWNAHLVTQWAITYAEWVQVDLGLMGQYSPKVEQQVDNCIRVPHSIELWDNGTKTFYPQRFVDYVESRRKNIIVKP